MGTSDKEGPIAFVATVHAGHNQLLIDDEENFITTNLPNDMFYHQMLICGEKQEAERQLQRSIWPSILLKNWKEPY